MAKFNPLSSDPLNAGDKPKKENVHSPYATESDGRRVYGSLFGKGNQEFLISFNFRYPKWRAWAQIRVPHLITFGLVFASAGFMVYPTYAEHYNALMRYDQPLKDPQVHLPNISPPWWVNQWRLNRCLWRNEESVDDFYVPVFDYIKQATGRDMLALPNARNYRKEKEALEKEGVFPVIQTRGIMADEHKKTVNLPFTTPPEPPRKDTPLTNSGKPWDREKQPRALVPMCGDSPILVELAVHGYQVDGVDCCDVAVRTATEKHDPRLRHWKCIDHVKLIWDDIFSPNVWKDLHKGSYDLVYDRQGMSAMAEDQREDYAFLLRRALKDDGILYVEGMDRTAKRKGNRQKGPPFHFGKEDLEKHFTPEDGFVVKCNTPGEIRLKDLPAEFRVLGRVPDELLTRGYPCVVYKDKKAVEAILADKRMAA